ncbi:DUF1929 domain-containing protein [Roseateles sp. DAIF2]|uniref:galactose oxidase early set domain-containing protein n=1 Tax=Roseateles sp. DAIF2 TaxID=2714952 RepID=UPI0018A2FB5A|nr:galactose oxidase early set domain-containing protein [Roseateles sp. DAIF2]QPF71728.1 DUF1929 domain-containing protein [Roseateles sp. DAIF2]
MNALQKNSSISAVALAVCSLLSGCNGEGEVASTPETKAMLGPTTKALTAPPTVPNAGVGGAWGNLGVWPLIPLHAVLLQDGRVLTYGSNSNSASSTSSMDWAAATNKSSISQQTGYFVYDIWDPAAGLGKSAHMVLPNGTGVDSFCSAQLLLPGDGKVFIAGGDQWTGVGGTYFGGTTNLGINNSLVLSYANQTPSLNSGSPMSRPRWYATTTTLPSGDILVHGGRPNTAYDANVKTDGTSGPTSGVLYAPEVRRADGSFVVLGSAGSSTNAVVQRLDYSNYPKNFVAPSGEVVGIAEGGSTFKISTQGTGSITLGLAPLSASPAPVSGNEATAVAYQYGRALLFGGASADTYMLKMPNSTSEAPKVESTGAALNAGRWFVNGTVLADGRVLATGGTSNWDPGYANEGVASSRRDQAIAAAINGTQNTPLIYDPQVNQWIAGNAPVGEPGRYYHSVALLLPDATVLVGGGGAHRYAPYENNNARIYYPPYLYDKVTGAAAARPTITSSPTATVQLGSVMSVVATSPNNLSISKFTLVKTGSVTHGLNMDQRFIELKNLGYVAGSWNLQIPNSGATLTPGFYMLFAIDAAGVPSQAKIIKIGAAATVAQEFSPSLSVEYSPARVAKGQSYEVRWTSNYATDITYTCSGGVSFTGSLPPGVNYKRSGSSNTPGQRNCIFTATGPGGSTLVNRTFEVY